MEFDDLLKLMVEKGGSDMFITAGVPPSVKINGKILPITKNPLSPDVVREVVMSIMMTNVWSFNALKNVTLRFPNVALAVFGSVRIINVT